MGNSASSQRGNFSQEDNRPFRQLATDRGDIGRDESRNRPSVDHDAEQSSGPDQLRHESRFDLSGYGTFRRQISSQSITVQRETGETIGTNAILYEQEERPLVNMEDLGMRNAPITHVAAAPLARRQSTMSRLGTRMLPAALTRGTVNEDEEAPAENRAQRTEPPGRRWNEEEFQRLGDGNRPRRALSTIFRTSRSTGSTARRHRIRGPLPTQYANAQLLRDESQESSPTNPSPPDLPSATVSTLTRQRTRLNRVRQSLSSFPIPNLFAHPPEPSSPQSAPRTPPRRPSRIAFAEDSDHLLPPFSSVDHRPDMEDAPHELDAVEPEARNVLSHTRPQQNTMRRLPHALRSRSTRLIRRGESAPLSHLLQLAAASIAAQLSGNPGPLLPGVRSTGNETPEDPIQHFIRTLQEAADTQTGETTDSTGSPDGSLPSVNFLRVFQFPHTEPPNPTPTASFAGSSVAVGHASVENLADAAAPGTTHESTVTLVLVGVRSMPTNGETPEEETVLGPSLDALLNMPFFPTTNVLRSGASGALLRRSEARSRFQSRRNSMTNFSSFPAQYDSQRHHRPRPPVNGSAAESSLHNPPPNPVPTVLSESPPGPHPPPSTPADARSGSATPSRRPSSASAIHSPILAHLDEHPSVMATENVPDAYLTTARQRRRSDSEFARRPELGSGASRRNGVVEPDHAPPSGGRSWLIYVVGTNVSPDHPAFTMPTLFTDNPSYEDMQLLSTLLGPVKPPVATREDIDSAGGIYKLRRGIDSLAGEPLTGEEEPSIALGAGARCLICLCDYEAREEVRRLGKCHHLYHRECIDEWLTTGRNSCPMCREQGVHEKESRTPQAATS